MNIPKIPAIMLASKTRTLLDTWFLNYARFRDQFNKNFGELLRTIGKIKSHHYATVSVLFCYSKRKYKKNEFGQPLPVRLMVTQTYIATMLQCSVQTVRNHLKALTGTIIKSISHASEYFTPERRTPCLEILLNDEVLYMLEDDNQLMQQQAYKYYLTKKAEGKPDVKTEIALFQDKGISKTDGLEVENPPPAVIANVDSGSEARNRPPETPTKTP